MTAEKLYGILQFLDNLDNSLGLQRTLESIRDALQNLTSSPAAPQHQSTLATALQSFEAAGAQLREKISPSSAVAIKSIGGEEFFDPAIVDKVKEAVQKNAMTPAVARDFVQNLSTKRSEFLTTVRNAKQGLEKLGVRGAQLSPGSADLAFLIPREIFKNELGSFAKELTFINRLVEHFSEAATGTAQPAQLEQLSSSVPTIALVAALPVMLLIGEVVNKFLEAWEKIEKIRKVRAELSEMGLKGAALDELTDQITTTVDQVVEESTQLVLTNYSGDGGRKAELKNAIKNDTLRLFGQVERGLTVELRVNPEARNDQTQADKEALSRIADLAKTLSFPEPAKQPMLLQTGEVVDGDTVTVNYSKKTTTHKKTVSKKATKEGEPVEATD